MTFLPASCASPLRCCAASLVLLLGACGKKAEAPPAPPPPEVVVQAVTQRTTPLSMEIVGEVKAFREVELRPRVTGLVTQIKFEPGQRVKEGELLMQIDPRPYDEQVVDAQAKLAESEAQRARSRQDVARYEPLLPDNAIPRQTYDQAVSQDQANAAVVTARKAALETSRLNRSYAEVRSPITGRIGLQKVEIGTLASAGQTVLATVSTLDPMVVYFNVPEIAYIDYTRRLQAAQKAGKSDAVAPIELLLADGSTYGQPGRLDFADRALNAATGTLTLRAVFPNADELLRPGMNTRVRVVSDVAENAILIPQAAVTEMLGKQFASVVGADNKVEQRPIVTGARIGELWLVQSGLKPGERVVVQGLQKAKPGVVVKPVEAPPAVAAASAPARP
jgi:membrane fusion protein (multidrug efflux system)